MGPVEGAPWLGASSGYGKKEKERAEGREEERMPG